MTDPEIRAPPIDTNGWTEKEILRHMWGELRDTNDKLNKHLIHAAKQDAKQDELVNRVDRQWYFIIGLPALIGAGIAIAQLLA